MGLREVRPFNESGGEIPRGFIRFVVQQQNQAKIVLYFGIARSELRGGVKMFKRFASLWFCNKAMPKLYCATGLLGAMRTLQCKASGPPFSCPSL